jgi:hypothetical protein
MSDALVWMRWQCTCAVPVKLCRLAFGITQRAGGRALYRHRARGVVMAPHLMARMWMLVRCLYMVHMGTASFPLQPQDNAACTDLADCARKACT